MDTQHNPGEPGKANPKQQGGQQQQQDREIEGKRREHAERIAMAQRTFLRWVKTGKMIPT